MAGFETALTMFQAISTTDVTPLARVPWNEPGIIMRLLDAGAMGIICPMIDNRADAEKFVGACRYHPLGYRSLGPTRARVYGGTDYAQQANASIITMAMVETAVGLANVDEIASTPGLDGLYIGPGDLSVSMGVEPGCDEHEQMIQRVLRESNEVGTPVGMPCGNPEDAKMRADQGFTLIHAGSEAGMIFAGIEHMKKTVGLA